MAGGGGRGRGARGGAAGGGYRFAPARHIVSLSSHRCPLAGPTKKEIGFADFDPFVFGQRPALRAGAEKCEGPLIGRRGPAPRARAPPAAASAAQFKGGCRAGCLGRLFINLLEIIGLSLASYAPMAGFTSRVGRDRTLTFVEWLNDVLCISAG